MNPEEFENKLASQPIRDLPAEWREQILAHAQPQCPRREPKVARNEFPWLRSIREALWPSPVAWAVLTCLWIIPMILNAVHAESSTVACTTSPPSALEKRLAREQRAFLLEELGVANFHSVWKSDGPPPTQEGSRSNREGDQLGGVAVPELCFLQKEFA